MQVKIYTDGAARGNPDGPGGYGTILSYKDSKGQTHITEQFFSTSIPKASYMNVNCPEATKKPQTTGWS